MDSKVMYDKLYEIIGNPYGVCGLMGNLHTESPNFKGNNLQNSYNKKLGMTDEEYTKAVDDGTYENFVNDSAGYGIVQWTYYARKQNLLDYAKSLGKSIGDENMQFDFMITELKGKKTVWNTLLNATSVKEASDIVCTQYERPANQSEEAKAHRAAYGEEFFNRFAKTEDNKTEYTNSKLVDVTILSPNHSGLRTHSIDRITPHCVVGQVSCERLGEIFIPESKNASCNYGIGTDGRVLLCVEEKNRSWCSSSNENDQRAITIECASDSTHPYAFNDKVYNKLIELCYDICVRNNKTKLIWIDDKDKALSYKLNSNEMLLTVHRWFHDKKSCPGDWMFERMSDLTDKVNNKLSGEEIAPIINPEPKNEEIYKVKVTIDNLNIRKGPGTNYETTGKFTGKGVFTIVETSKGNGSKNGWGKLKSGAGWICLDYAKKLEV